MDFEASPNVETSLGPVASEDDPSLLSAAAAAEDDVALGSASRAADVIGVGEQSPAVAASILEKQDVSLSYVYETDLAPGHVGLHLRSILQKLSWPRQAFIHQAQSQSSGDMQNYPVSMTDLALVVFRCSTTSQDRRGELALGPCRVRSACDAEVPFHRWKQELQLPSDGADGDEWEPVAKLRSNYVVYDRRRARACLDSEIFEKFRRAVPAPAPGLGTSSKLQDEFPTLGTVFTPRWQWSGRWRAPVSFCDHAGEVMHLHVPCMLSLLNLAAGAVDHCGSEEPQGLFVKFHSSAKADRAHECCVCWDERRALYVIGDPVAICIVANYGSAELCVEDVNLVALGPGLWGALRRGSCSKPLDKFLNLSECTVHTQAVATDSSQPPPHAPE